MIGGILITMVLFMIAIAMCIAINFVIFRYLWEDVSPWIQEIAYVISITVVMFVLYHLVGHVWGVYNFVEG